MRRRVVVIAGLLVVLAIGAVAGLRASVGMLRREITGALGAGAEIGSLEVGVTQLAVNELVLPGGAGWPSDAALRAERVTIQPSLRSLLSRQIRIASVEVAGPYVSMLRTRAGRLRIVPTLLESASATPRPPAATHASAPAPPPVSAPAAPGRSVMLRRLTISEGEVEVYDATVATPPWRIRLIGLDATFGSVVVPQTGGRSPIEVRATVDGPARDGTVVLAGWIDPATRDLQLTARLRGVDLLAFQPYAMRTSKARLSSGQFDLDVRATVRDGRLSAPGHVVIADLAFAPGGRGSDHVLGVPRDLLLAALASQDGRLAFDFQLDGDLADPRFSLNETLGVRMAAGLVESVGGLSLPGLVGGVTGLGGTTIEGAGKVGKSVGDALNGLLRRR
jgi:hypothetical protein